MANTMATSPKLSEHKTDESVETKSRNLSPLPAPLAEQYGKLRYVNNLLPAIGYLDLANGLDFPANVWNQVPVPIFAKVLMGIGGSIAILSTAFCFVDLRRSRKNIEFLRQERRLLKQQRSADPHLWRLEQSWLDTNFRELGWELIDRMLLDVCMLIAGILVGIGTLMAIKGEIKAIFHASNLLSGYIGNSFVALYAVTNMAWSVFMWKRAARNHSAFKHMSATIRPDIQHRFKSHTRRHQIFAIVNGPTAVVSGVGSLISATLWPGYIVLIPGIIGSVFANHFWRFKLGYSRDSIQEIADIGDFDVLQRIAVIVDIRAALRNDGGLTTNFCELISTSEKGSNRAIVSFLRDHGMYQQFLDSLQKAGFTHDMQYDDAEQALDASPELDFRRHPKVSAAVNECIRAASKSQFRHEERFLSELYGCYCYWDQVGRSKASATPSVETQPQKAFVLEQHHHEPSDVVNGDAIDDPNQP